MYFPNNEETTNSPPNANDIACKAIKISGLADRNVGDWGPSQELTQPLISSFFRCQVFFGYDPSSSSSLLSSADITARILRNTRENFSVRTSSLSRYSWKQAMPGKETGAETLLLSHTLESH